MKVVLRKASLLDLNALLEFEQGIIAYERSFDPTLKQDPISYYDLEKIIKNQDSEVYVAEVDGTLVSSGHIRIYQGESFNHFEKYAFLGFMYTLPEFRGKGLNQLISKELMTWAKERNLNEVRLKVYSENTSALKAYEKSGFKPFLTEMRFTEN